jgi:phospholipase C
MNAAGTTWKWYGDATFGTSGYQWTNPDYYLNFYNGTAQWTSHVVTDSQFVTDAAAGTLPQVSFITSVNWNSAHPPESMCANDNYIIQTLNAIAAGSQWSHMLVVVVYDDWGGIYDHVSPPIIDSMGYGIRVPFLVISPYAKAGNAGGGPPYSVIHTQIDAFSAVDREIEEIFGLPSLGNRDTVTADLSTFLDFTQTPLTLPTEPLDVIAGSNCHTVPWPL